jgi:hypothetical protein
MKRSTRPIIVGKIINLQFIGRTEMDEVLISVDELRILRFESDMYKLSLIGAKLDEEIEALNKECDAEDLRKRMHQAKWG